LKTGFFEVLTGRELTASEVREALAWRSEERVQRTVSYHLKKRVVHDQLKREKVNGVFVYSLNTHEIKKPDPYVPPLEEPSEVLPLFDS